MDTLSVSLDADIRDVQALVDMGYLDRDFKANLSGEDSSRQKLVLELEKSLNEMKAAASHAQKGPVSYGQQLYSEKTRRR